MSKLEDELAGQILLANLPLPVRQSTAPWEGTGRRFRADFCWPDEKLVVETEGGTWTGGRHTSGSGFERDCVKQTLAVLAGWRYMRVTSNQIKSGEALTWIETALSTG